MKIINDINFINARIVVYIVLIISFFIILLTDVQCSGCPLCGMTRGVICILKLDFVKALSFNSNIWIFFFIIPIIILDILNILMFLIKRKK